MNNVTDVSLTDLKKHPQNYRTHPEDQLDHLCKSIQENGIYRPVVIAKDNTILAGHGVTQACKRLGIEKVPTIKMEIESDSKEALKLLTADNEISNLAEVNDRKLTEILKEMANLVMVTRDASEIKDLDHAKEWVGMPTFFEENEHTTKEKFEYKVCCDSEEHLIEFVEKYDLPTDLKRGRIWSVKYPEKTREDVGSLRFEDE